eukprot:TRINITY_DN2476_c0_g1_i3.p1 TRINITY_DN2476_c0_g1~~TRINITY_DN2476_c0_g1_i3.p1  ORF type:complete len:303 (-),score=73.94 TRINITY_DN2476_c0_g1_i3:150-1058(-)
MTTITTTHEDTIHDVQFDYNGKRIATCSSDRTIKIFDAALPESKPVELKGHDGPVWSVAWAHPKYGNLLASCSYDKRVIVWRESSLNNWEQFFEYTGHTASVGSVCWAPPEYGLVLATASADGYVSLLTYNKDNSWRAEKFLAHKAGVNAVSWAPAISPASLLSAAPAPPPARRLVTGGCDNTVRVWRYQDAEHRFVEQATLDAHRDWVRDVAWAPSIGMPYSCIASCSQDGVVIVWTQDASAATWAQKELTKFAEPVWHVSWSITGNVLAVSSGQNKVTLWKESPDNEWKQIAAPEAEAAQ